MAQAATEQVAGKVAIVTGGASGIGEACAGTLAREGAAVLVTDVDDVLGQGVVFALRHCSSSQTRRTAPARGNIDAHSSPEGKPK